jgi:hypothetical protein
MKFRVILAKRLPEGDQSIVARKSKNTENMWRVMKYINDPEAGQIGLMIGTIIKERELYTINSRFEGKSRTVYSMSSATWWAGVYANGKENFLLEGLQSSRKVLLGNVGSRDQEQVD